MEEALLIKKINQILYENKAFLEYLGNPVSVGLSPGSYRVVSEDIISHLGEVPNINQLEKMIGEHRAKIGRTHGIDEKGKSAGEGNIVPEKEYKETYKKIAKEIFQLVNRNY